MLQSNKNGVILDQQKEPALSRDIIPFLSATTLSCTKFEPVENPSALLTDDYINLAKRANIIDERDGQPLAKKLEEWKGRTIKALVGDAIDDEPYVSSQINPLLKRGDEITTALNLLANTMKAQDRYIAIYKNMYNLDTKIPAWMEKVQIKRISGKYPMESRAIKDLGEDVLLLGTGSLMHLYRAITQGIPQTTSIVTVAGNCVGNPANLEVTLGTTMSLVLERCGLIREPTYIVQGGAMKGICVLDPEHTVIKADTRAILAFREDKKEQRYNCIGCGRCVEVCPSGLNPQLIYQAVNANRYTMAKKLHPERCISCSTCSYICPSKLELCQMVAKARDSLQKNE